MPSTGEGHPGAKSLALLVDNVRPRILNGLAVKGPGGTGALLRGLGSHAVGKKQARPVELRGEVQFLARGHVDVAWQGRDDLLA